METVRGVINKRYHSAQNLYLPLTQKYYKLCVSFFADMLDIHYVHVTIMGVIIAF